MRVCHEVTAVFDDPHLDAPSPGQEQDHATSMITKGTTLHPGLVVLRAGSAFYGHDIIATAAGSRSHS